MTPREIDQLRRHLYAISQATTHLQQHLLDLYYLAWEAPTTDTEQVAATKTDHTPRTGHPKALHLYRRLCTNLAKAEALVVGDERAILGYFMTNGTTPEPTRGSLIPLAEHEKGLAQQTRQAANGHYVPARIETQPAHPGKPTQSKKGRR